VMPLDAVFLLVIPAKAGIQSRSHRKISWFRSLPKTALRAGYFPFGESNQSHCARA